MVDIDWRDPTCLPAANGQTDPTVGDLSRSLSSSLEATIHLAELESPTNGVSLLDIRNDMFLSYLQNLVFFILLRLRRSIKAGKVGGYQYDLKDCVSQKLVELRLYIVKGALNFEEKMRHQLNILLRSSSQFIHQRSGPFPERDAAPALGISDVADIALGHAGGAKSDSEADDSNFQLKKLVTHAPRLSSFVTTTLQASAYDPLKPDGIRRRPKREQELIESGQRRQNAERKPQRSTILDEFVMTELSAAPVPEPSIGTAIMAGGRRVKTNHEKRGDDERREYEESYFVRLPQEGKKEQAQKERITHRNSRFAFGGEEWTELRHQFDRIGRLTKPKENIIGVNALLAKSRKRTLDPDDGVELHRGGANIGERFHKKLRAIRRAK